MAVPAAYRSLRPGGIHVSPARPRRGSGVDDHVPVRIRGATVLVTGAGSGIGRATALRFARERVSLVLADIDEDAAQQTARLVRDLSAVASVHRVDVSDAAAMETFALAVRDQ
ncbi:MAG: SDR family NAD(P)-dependent oxidoreductase, partial [Chloroflexi bacterium]